VPENARVGLDRGKPCGILRLRHGIALVRRLAKGDISQLIALLPLRHKVLADAYEPREFRIALGTARGHLRQRLRRLRALPPLRGLERLNRQLGAGREAVRCLDESFKCRPILLRLALPLPRHAFAGCLKGAKRARHEPGCTGS